MKIKLGDKVKDKLTDLEGTVTAECAYLYGCTQFQVQPRELENGQVVEGIWVDEPQLELIKDNEKEESEPTYGGIRKHPD